MKTSKTVDPYYAILGAETPTTQSETIRDLRRANEIATAESDLINSSAPDDATRARLLTSAAGRFADAAERQRRESSGSNWVTIYESAARMLRTCAEMAREDAARSLPVSVRAFIESMPTIDLYDYLADHAEELRDATPDEMRSAVVADVVSIGPKVFWCRMCEGMQDVQEPATTPRTKGASDPGSRAALAAFLGASIALGMRQRSGGNPRAPLRIPDTDPRIRIPARFAPAYLLQGGAS